MKKIRELWVKMRRVLRPMKKEYRQLFGMTLKKWLLYHQKNIVFEKCHWMGVRALKNPFDAWIYQEIIYDVKPDIIIEIGSCEGGSTLYLANLLDMIGKGTVISVDIDRSAYKIKHNKIVEITGDSSSPEIVKKVADLCQNKSVLIIHDGDHHKEKVLEDLRNYSKFVSKNSYFIVEDGIVDLFKPGDGIGWLDGGPLEATEQFLRENPDFIADNNCERYIVTYNPKGFLKKIK